MFFYGNPSANKFRAVKDGNNVNYKFTSNIISGQQYFEITQNSLFRRPSSTAEYTNISTTINTAKNSSSLVDKNMLIVLLAGINTDPGGRGIFSGFFANLATYLENKIPSLGYKPAFRVIYPYGVGGSVLTTVEQAKSVLIENKGSVTANNIKSLYDNESRVILIGHSGGGVAGYDALKILGDESAIPVKHLIMIGSPKMVIKTYVSKTTAIYAPLDEVTLGIGKDSEYTAGRDEVVYYKPGDTKLVNLTVKGGLGGHMEYFTQPNISDVGNKIYQTIKGAI